MTNNLFSDQYGHLQPHFVPDNKRLQYETDLRSGQFQIAAQMAGVSNKRIKITELNLLKVLAFFREVLRCVKKEA